MWATPVDQRANSDPQLERISPWTAQHAGAIFCQRSISG